MYRLGPGEIWRWLKREPASFWFVCTYLFFEYVRPQHIYDAIEGPPYARIFILLAAAFFLIERTRVRFEMPEILLGIFSLALVGSSFLAVNPQISYDNFDRFFPWVLIYLLIANSVDREDRFLVFTLSFLLYSFKMSQHGAKTWAMDGFVFRSWGATGAPGWFENSGEFGIQMCVFLPLLVSFIAGLKRYWGRYTKIFWWGVVGSAIISIIASSSRGAQFGMIVVGLWVIAQSRHRFRTLVIAVVVAGGAYLTIPAEQKARFETMGDDQTSVSRTTYWKNGLDIIRDHPVHGIGFSNWQAYYTRQYGFGALPHNIFIEAASEMGYVGLGAFLVMIGGTFVLNWRTRRIARDLGDRGVFMFEMAHGFDGALIGFLVSGFFITVLYYPFFWINFAMTVSLNRSVRHAVGTRVDLPWRSPVAQRAERRVG